jgi:uncharacterized protein
MTRERGISVKEAAGERNLDPDATYHLLRDPEALAASIDRWNGLVVLPGHWRPCDVRPRNIGTAGMDARFDGRDLTVSIMVWDADALAGIADRSCAELSAAYWRDLEMSPGRFRGEPYDGIFTNIEPFYIGLCSDSRLGLLVEANAADQAIYQAGARFEEKLNERPAASV